MLSWIYSHGIPPNASDKQLQRNAMTSTIAHEIQNIEMYEQYLEIPVTARRENRKKYGSFSIIQNHDSFQNDKNATDQKNQSSRY